MSNQNNNYSNNVFENNTNNSNICGICHDKFTTADPAVKTRCQHRFHLQCLRTWVDAQFKVNPSGNIFIDPSKSTPCPICRTQGVFKNVKSYDELQQWAETRTQIAQSFVKDLQQQHLSNAQQLYELESFNNQFYANAFKEINNAEAKQRANMAREGLTSNYLLNKTLAARTANATLIANEKRKRNALKATATRKRNALKATAKPEWWSSYKPPVFSKPQATRTQNRATARATRIATAAARTRNREALNADVLKRTRARARAAARRNS